MAENKNNLFRKKALDRISSPEQLNDYLRVTNPGIWAVLIAVILFLAGVFVWACTGTLETKTPATAVVQNKTALVVVSGGSNIEEGMALRIREGEYTVGEVSEDEYGRRTAVASVDLPDGRYDAVVVTDETKPVEFLLKASE